MSVAKLVEKLSPESDPALTITDVAKCYQLEAGRSSVALEPVTTTIGKGEFVSLIGPSGCGKTTLLKMCANLIAPTSGSISFARTGLPAVPGSYGVVFQTPALLPWKTVLDNVILPARILHRDKAQACQRARELLGLMRLSGTEGQYPNELSGGMQQRAAIARALLIDPDLLFMDEPFGALDAMTREELNMELQRIHQDQEKTILFVTHDIEEAVLLSDRILVLSSGPGRLVDDMDIDLRRPRTAESKLEPGFREYALKIRSLLDSEITGAEAK